MSRGRDKGQSATGRDTGPLEVSFTLGPLKLVGNDRPIRADSRYYSNASA
eukprot:gene6736-15806_t